MSLIHGELIIAVDFDGTITTERDMGKELVLRDRCKEVLERLYEDDAKLILWTCRTGDAYFEARDFLINHDMWGLFSAYNSQLPEVEEKYFPDVARKVGADVYIDDKNIFCGEVNWTDIEKYIYGEE